MLAWSAKARRVSRSVSSNRRPGTVHAATMLPTARPNSWTGAAIAAWTPPSFLYAAIATGCSA